MLQRLGEKLCFFAAIVIVSFAKKQRFLKKNLEKKINTLNSAAVVWKVSYYKNDPSILTIFPVHEK